MGEKRIDLNLMNVLYAVMAEGSVTRAASRLSMSQPAVSNALRKLRYLLKDELFIKIPGGLRPTEKATEIWPVLQTSLDQLRAIALPPDFVPATTRLTFNVAITETLVSRVVPALSARFLREAPLATLHFHLHSNPVSTDGLERAIIDCAVGMFPNPNKELNIEGILSDDYVCIFRKGNPNLANPLASVADLVRARHVSVKQATWDLAIVDRWLAALGQRRNIVLVVNTAMAAIQVVRATDLAATVPRRFVSSLPDTSDIEIADLPFDHEKIVYKLAWHRRTDRDAARKWLRATIRKTVLDVCAE